MLMKTKPPMLTYKEQVTTHIQKLEPQLAEIIEYIRQVILRTDKEIGEHINGITPVFIIREKCSLLILKNIKETL
jgi:hypothetical protein